MATNGFHLKTIFAQRRATLGQHDVQSLVCSIQGKKGQNEKSTK
jgi:hypothetical protein